MLAHLRLVRVLSLVFSVAGMLVCSYAAFAADSQKRVLVLHSNRRDALNALLADRELPRLIEKGFPEGVDYYSEYIDLPRFSDPGYQTAFRDFLSLKYNGLRLDAVVAIQDVALQFVRANRDDLFRGVPVVFLANTTPPAIPNSTGLIIERKFGSTVALATALQPDLRHVFLVSGANDGDRVFERNARDQLGPFESRLNLVYLSGLSTQDLKLRLARLPAHSMVFYLLVYKDGAGENVHPLEYLDMLVSVSSAPIYSWADQMMGRGIVGGNLVSQDAEMKTLADLVVRVLGGEMADSIPQSSPDFKVAQLDWRALTRWGIRESRIPPGTLVRFRQPSAWDRYRVYILTVTIIVAAQSLLIAGLLVQKRMRRRAEMRVRDNEAALRVSNERIHDLGGRLLRAQEAERARIARELHDDVNQQVALLAIDLEMLQAEDSEQPGAKTLVHEACERAHGIAKSLHDLSHQLHPARLRMLGLVPALNGLQRELSRPEVTINVSAEDVPTSLPEEVTLCLFRIAQEALQNALTHSGASVISLHLVGEVDELVMTILDDGVGFDVDEAWRKGLGLVSMSERLESIGGTIDIQSGPREGTRLTISVPYHPAGARDAVGV